MEAILSKAQELIAAGEADLSALGKPFCDQLTAEQWAVVRGKKLYDNEILQLETIAGHSHFEDKPHTRQRLYELAKIARLENLKSSAESLEGLVKQLKADVADGKNTPSAYAMLGACYIAEDRYDLGVYYFNKSNSITARNNCITGFMGLSRAMPPISAFDIDEDYIDKPALDFKGQVIKFSKGVVAVVAGNELYINRFLVNYVESILQKGHGSFAGIHVHWVKESIESDDVIDEALSAALQVFPSINCTVEEIYGFSDKKSYYAQSRFLAAKRLSEFYELPLLITDLDFQLNADPRPAFDKLSFIDVSFFQHKVNTAQWAFPWLRSMAGSVWVNKTDEAREFFKKIEIGFESSFNPSWFNWGIDQNLLTAALEHSRKNAQLNFASFADVAGPHLFNVPVGLKAGIKSQ